jgi:uncharacterized protein (DUF433 family)
MQPGRSASVRERVAGRFRAERGNEKKRESQLPNFYSKKGEIVMSETIFQPVVVRTERGLTVGGTRITLYQIMDFVKAGESPEFIRDLFRLTIRQTEEVMTYIRNNYDEFEKEYQKVVREWEEIRQYWEERNRERFAEIASRPRKPEHKEIWAKLDEWKARLSQDEDTD